MRDKIEKVLNEWAEAGADEAKVEALRKQLLGILERLEAAEEKLGIQQQSGGVYVLEMDGEGEHRTRPLTAQERARLIHRAKLTEEYGARGAELILSAGDRTPGFMTGVKHEKGADGTLLMTVLWEGDDDE